MRKILVLAFVGFFAQLIDGSLGMAYGVTSTTLLLATGVAPAAASAAVHFSEIGTSLVSGISHHKLGNVDWRTVGILAGPGFVGAFAGATLLVNLDGEAAVPWIAGILLTLGFYVVFRFLVLAGARPTMKARPSARMLVPIGFAGGTLDAVGGGGWGPVGTTTLLSSGRLEPRKVVGSVDTSEFVVAVGGSVGFLLALGSAGIDWEIVVALLAGGVVAAPIAAYLVRILPARVLGVAAGGLIIITNLRTILLSFEVDGSTIWMVLLAMLMLWLTAIGTAVRAHRRSLALEVVNEATDGEPKAAHAG